MDSVKKILDDRNIEYREKGKDFLIKCLNPDHDDSHPSMRIDAVTGLYHCFSCGFKGNLLKDSGANVSPANFRITSLKRKIANILSPSLEMPKTAIMQKLECRGIPAEILQKFDAFTESELYPDRIVFPIRDFSNNIISFLGRYTHSDAPPKYKLYPDGASLNLFPSKPTIRQNAIILVEGLFDVLNMYKHGVKNGVATLGTNSLIKRWKEQFFPLKAQGVNKIFICMDGDDAGRQAAQKLNKLLNQHFDIEIIDLPEGKDPGGMTKSEINKYIVEDYLL